MASEATVPTTAPAPYTAPNVVAVPPRRDPAALIAELIRRRTALPRSRDERAFIDLHKGCHE